MSEINLDDYYYYYSYMSSKLQHSKFTGVLESHLELHVT